MLELLQVWDWEVRPNPKNIRSELCFKNLHHPTGRGPSVASRLIAPSTDSDISMNKSINIYPDILFHICSDVPSHICSNILSGISSGAVSSIMFGILSDISTGFRICSCFFCSGFGLFFGFLSGYRLPCICNSLELESVILHGICYILAWLLCILHGICYIWPCPPSILHGIRHVLALQPLISMVFATCWYFKRSCGFLETFFKLSFRVHLYRVRIHLGFH